MSSTENKWEVRPGNPTCLGTTRTWDGYNFTIKNSEKKAIEIAFYKEDETPVERIVIPEEYSIGDLYSIEILKKDLHEYEYMYYMDEEPYTDMYARLTCGRECFGSKVDSVNGMRSKVLQEASVCELDEYIPYEQMLVYKVHTRGYTMQKDSGVEHKGTFLGLIEKIPYWKELGVTTLELMPVYDFLEYPMKKKIKSPINYWGYTGGFYFAPKASYAVKQPDVELKQLISELHKNGMECLLEFYFAEDVTPDLALQILRFWKMEYKADGFILRNGQKWMELFAKDAILADTKIIGSEWDADTLGMVDIPVPRRLGEYNVEFQKTMRRFLKGDENQIADFQYFNRRNPATFGCLHSITNHDGFTLADLVSYNWRHNEGNGENNQDGPEENHSWNCGEEGPAKTKQVKELRQRQMRNAMLLLLLSQGTPVIYGGDEFGNSQKGNNNAYCQDNEIGWVDWSQKEEMEPFTTFVKEIIAFRKNHPILHMPYELVKLDLKGYGWPEISYHSEAAWVSNTENYSRQIGILYCGTYAKDIYGKEDALIYVAYNMYWAEHKLALPDLPEHKNWYVAINSGQPAEEAVFEAGKEMKITDKKYIRMQGRTIIVLIGK